ncbi:hypothetical protein [Alistipes sp.]|uniref:hypothetical protein n=1 Tax=Alistipes sp. TaxID=1872444 RepID=UPI003AF05189
MKRYTLVLVLLLAAAPLAAQTRREALLEYQSRRRRAYTEFREDYRKACADFMRKRWEAFRAEAPVPVPERKEPDRPVMRQPDAPVIRTPKPIVPNRIVELPEAPPEARPAPVATPTKIDASRTCRFAFYGTECSVSLGPDQHVRLASRAENSVADAWERIAGSYDRVAAECSEMKEQLRLNDWGYYDLVRTLADAYCGRATDESTLVQSFLMAEAGYKVRLARGRERLHLLLALDDRVYARPYFRIGGQTFYLLDGSATGGQFSICNFSIPGERVLSLSMPEPPLLSDAPAAPAVRNDAQDGISTTVTPNRNLLDFLEDYPPCYWNIYASARLSASVREQLLPPLRRAIAGKGEYQAAAILLHYLHRAFPYKTDDAQFGGERTLFAEEMFFFPYSDCEDRSVLFVQLVGELLQLKTVLLYYPNHIAAAVRFHGEAVGDYVSVGRERYTVCDPTYIGAEIGEAMPGLEQTPVEIIRID